MKKKVHGRMNKLYSKKNCGLGPDRVCSIFSGAGKFCLVHGLRQRTRDVESDFTTVNFRSDVTYALPRKSSYDVRKRSLCKEICLKIKEMTNDK